jgi:hypothetical protein
MSFAVFGRLAGAPGAPHRAKPPRRSRVAGGLAALAIAALAASVVTILPSGAPVARAADPLISQGKVVSCSSVENVGTPCANAVDGNTGTRWSSAFSDPQWIQIDLGATATISQVVLNWETAAGKAFQIQTSPNATTWTAIYNTTTGTGGIQTLTVAGSGRYVRMYGTVRTTGYGYSLWEFQVFGTFGTPTPPPPTPTPTPVAGCGTNNAALNKPATASSIENAGTPASAAVDGNTGTRWSSAFSDPQWLQVDLGSTLTICRVVLNWETAAGKSFQIQTSNDATNWTSIYSTTTGTGGIQTLTVAGSGRYVRMYGTVRTTAYGYSLWEFTVNTGVLTPTPTPSTAPISPTPIVTPSSGPSSGVFWDTSNIPVAKNVMTFKFLNRTNGKYPDSQVFWSFNGQVHSIADAPTFDMPANSSGRMYFGLGVAPNAANNSSYWDFIEFTIGPAQFNGNTTRVDAFGLKLAMRLHNADGTEQTVGENLATFTEDRATTFNRFVAAMPAEFKPCGTVMAPYRIPEPGGGCGFNAGGVNQNYYNSYIDQMWANNGITIAKPGPNGSGLGAYPDLSAAIFRHVGAAAGSFNTNGTIKNTALFANPATFYTAAPAMYYAKFWHDNAYDGKAYGFPYDDVGGYSSYISHANPQYMLVAIGW